MYIRPVLVCLLLCLPFLVRAQKDTIILKDVEILAGRISALCPGTLRPVSSVSGQSIKSLPASDFSELLLLTPGFDIRTRGVNGAQSDVSVRGGSFEQTLILLNGFPMNDPQTGHHNLDLPVGLEQIVRMEFLRGPAARVYGANALSGAVNFITQEDPENRISIFGNLGSWAFYNMGVSAALKIRNSGHFIDAGAKTCKGYTDNTDFKSRNFFYRGVIPTSVMKLDVQAAYLDKAFGANSFYSARYPDQFERTKTGFLALKSTMGGSRMRWVPFLSWRRHQDHFELFRKDTPSWYSGHNNHLTDVVTTGISLAKSGKWGKLSAGFNYRYEHIFSNVLGILLSQFHDVPGESGSFFTHAAARDLWSAFIDYGFHYKRFGLNTGLMLHYSTQFGLGYYPGAEAEVRVNKSVAVYISANRSLRLPTFTDLYYQSPVNIGNAGLHPEEAWEFEGGVKWEEKWMNAHAAFFFRKAQNLIDWVKMEGDSIWHSENLTSLNTYGPELEWVIHPDKIEDTNFFLKEITLSWQMIWVEKGNNDLISYYVLDYLKHKAGLSVSHKVWKGIYASWSLVYLDRAGSYTDPISLLETPYPSTWIFNGRLGWNQGPLNFYVMMDNILNSQYRDFSSVIMPGRWMNAGFSLNVK